MGLVRGPGVVRWEHDHQATPMSDEIYMPPDFQYSVTLEQVADAQGRPAMVLLCYSKATNQIGIASITVAHDTATYLLEQAGYPAPSEAQHAIMAAWIACEGGLPHNNPLNVTGDWPGVVGRWNDVGVAIFDTLEHGAQACARNLVEGIQYGGLRAALAAGDPAAFCADLGLATWGTRPDCVRSVLGVSNAG